MNPKHIQAYAVLRGKFIAIHNYMKNLGKKYTSDLTAHLKALKLQKDTQSGGVDCKK